MDHMGNDPDGQDSGPMFDSLRRRRGPSGRAGPIAAVVVVVALIVAGVVWYRSRAAHQPPETAQQAPPPSDTTQAAAAAPAQPAPLPALDSSDLFVRRLAHGLSTHPLVAAWLANRELIRRFVVAVADVANGQSPAPRLEFMAPRGPFRIRKTQGRIEVDPASYRRYNAATAAFVSLDTAGVAKLYHRIQPLCDQAYKELGLPGGPFEDALARAFGRLLAVRVPAKPPELVEQGAVYAFADPHLQALSAAAKQLVRMGPSNAALVQAKLKALAAAMGVQPRAPEGSGRK